MYEVKIGKLMVQEVINARNAEGDPYEYVDINSYSNADLSVIGEKLIKETDLFIAFMDAINMSDILEGGKDYSSLEYKSLEEVFGIVDDFTTLSNNSKYYFDENKMQYIEKSNSNNISDEELGKLAFNYIYNDTDEYKTISEEDILKIKKDMKKIWHNIEDNKKDLVKSYLLNPKKDECEISSKVWDEIQESVDKIVVNNLKYFYLYDGKWEKLSELGKMIWHRVMKYDSCFANISEKIEEDESFDFYMECIANNIEENHLTNVTRCTIYDAVKNYCNEIDDNSKIYEAMMMATGDMCVNNLSHIAKWDEDELMWDLIDNPEDYYLELTKKALEGDIEFEFCFGEEGEHDVLDIYFKNVKDFNSYKPTIIMWFDEINDCSNRSTERIVDMISMHEEGYSLGHEIAYNGVATSTLNNDIMSNILKLLSIKGYNYKMVESSIDSVEEDITSNNIDINFSSNLEITDAWKEEDAEFFNISCMLPYINLNGEYKFTDELKFKYERTNERAIMLNDDIKRFIGINLSDLTKKINSIYKNYIKVFGVKAVELN